jgi:thiol-disulfide isomerase/thioredoxin
MKLPRILIATVVAGVLAVPTLAGDGKLGDPAKPLKIKEWAKGDAVDLAAGKGKTTYVVEFWATWCPPCRASIPHLTEIQKKFKDKNVVVIGVSDEKPDVVKPFVKKMGDKMNYTVAVDDNRSTFKAYMAAFGQGGIPHAFIVGKDGTIVWHGHPMAGLDEALEQIVAGKYDMESQKHAEMAAKYAKEYLTLVSQSKEPTGAKEMAAKVLKYGSDNAQLMNAVAWEVLTGEGIMARDLEFAMKAAEAAVKASDAKNAAILDTYARAFYETGDYKAAVKWQKKAVACCESDDMRPELEKALKMYEEKVKGQP